MHRCLWVHPRWGCLACVYVYVVHHFATIRCTERQQLDCTWKRGVHTRTTRRRLINTCAGVPVEECGEVVQHYICICFAHISPTVPAGLNAKNCTLARRLTYVWCMAHMACEHRRRCCDVAFSICAVSPQHHKYPRATLSSILSYSTRGICVLWVFACAVRMCIWVGVYVRIVVQCNGK